MQKTDKIYSLIIIISIIMNSVTIAQNTSTVAKANIQNRIDLNVNWQICNSKEIKAKGDLISTSGYQPQNWINASVPSTVMGTLTKNGEYKDIFMGDNIYKIDKTQFNSSWWYKTEFTLQDITEKTFICFDGISYYANIWLNGTKIASKDSTYGTFRRFQFDISNLVTDKKNVLAVEVFRQQAGDLGHGFVDWNPRPPDENLGLWRPVYIKQTGLIELKNSFVRTKVNLETLNEAWLEIETNIINHSDTEKIAEIKGSYKNKPFSIKINLKPYETKNIRIDHSHVKQLHDTSPKLWWSYDYGEPILHTIELSILDNEIISDYTSCTFGIRQIESYFNDQGHLGIKLNGKKILIRGAGWTDDIFLRDTKHSNEIQISYVKDMNLNTIRFENIWGTTQNIYELCDKYGILAMVGWSCQWEWENYLGKKCGEFGGIISQHDQDLAYNYLEDQILWLRNHPSICFWMVGSDFLPIPSLETRYKELINRIDNRPYVASAASANSSVSGNTGVKMNGPYDYVGPNYWYIDKKFGGAFGFNTETGPGPQIPNLQTIKKMIPSKSLWPIDTMWNKHCCTSQKEFNSMDMNTNIMNQKLGKADNLNDYLRKSEFLAYDAIAAMYEAFRVNRTQTTGIIQWMLNSAWPSFYWQLYDHDLIPTSAYYATKKANQPVQSIYNYKDNSIYLVNSSIEKTDSVEVQFWLVNLAGEIIENAKINVSCLADASKKVTLLKSLKQTMFLFLETKHKTENIIYNHYVLSVDKDKYDWEKTYWAYTPMTDYANMIGLASLKKAKISNSINKLNDNSYEIIISNDSNQVAFSLNIEGKNKAGEIVKPIYYSDNYITLRPGEKRRILVKTQQIVDNINFIVEGWNTTN